MNSIGKGQVQAVAKANILGQAKFITQRTLAWLTCYGRLTNDYILADTPETFIYVAMVRLMFRRLA